MNKTTIAKLRKIAKDPIQFLDECLDTSTAFLVKHLQHGFLLSLVVIFGTFVSVISPRVSRKESSLPANYPTSITLHPSERQTQPRLEREGRADISSAVFVKKQQSDKQSNTILTFKASMLGHLMQRVRRFPLCVVLSVRPADTETKLRCAFSLKLFNRAIYQPFFSDAFLDVSSKPIVSYGIYLNTYSATQPIWKPVFGQENRIVIYRSLARFCQYVKHSFSARPLTLVEVMNTPEVQETAAATVVAMQQDTSADRLERSGLVRTQSAFPMAPRNLASASVSPQDPSLSTQPNWTLASTADFDQPEDLQKKIGTIVEACQKSIFFKIDVLKILVIKIEQ